jgi:hypothetical protein
MKLLLATTREDRSRQRIFDEARERGLDVEMVYYEDLERGGVDKERLSGFDYLIPRDPYNIGQDLSQVMNELVSLFGEGKVLDHDVFTQHPEYEDKLFQHGLFGEVMDMPGTREPEEAGGAFPVLFKKKISSRGRGIFIIREQEELDRFLKEKQPEDFFVENMISITRDVRILMIGNEIVGAVERRIRTKDNHGYQGIGVKVTGRFEVPEELKEKAREISKRSGSDFCGLDVVFDEQGKAWLLEVNISPQFVALERVLEENVAGKLIEHVMKQA